MLALDHSTFWLSFLSLASLRLIPLRHVLLSNLEEGIRGCRDFSPPPFPLHVPDIAYDPGLVLVRGVHLGLCLDACLEHGLDLGLDTLALTFCRLHDLFHHRLFSSPSI